MKKIKSAGLLFLIIISTTAFAQLKRANKFYDHYDYARAIELYKKLLNKEEDAEALEKIANCYRLTRNYAKAEQFYSRLITIPGINPVNHFYYGEVLKNQNKPDEAKQQFNLYLNTVPNDREVQESVKSCDNVKIWVKKTQQFDITPVAGLNTSHSEFSPSIVKDKLIFTSDRTQDLVNNFNYSWNKQPFLNEYYVTILGKKDSNLVLSKTPKLMPWPVNTAFHDGPMCFDEKTNTMYITRVDYEVKKRNLKFINRPKLFSATMVGNNWEDMKPFKYNSDDYSVAHPSVSSDGQWLFFASDMPGGKGGFDIYRCHKETDGWGIPENLGDEVNSANEELFPFIRKDGTLYFASDRHTGFGGLDVFSATMVNNKYSGVSNLGAPLNSSTDDFGIIFTDDFTRGYFSSDRASGKGADDIYSFIALNKYIQIEGKLLLSQNINDPLKNMQIKLLTEDGKLINSTVTDSIGHFKFENLNPDIKYLVQLDETNPQLVDKDKVYMANTNDKIVRVIVINDRGGKFIFNDLPLDPNEMELIPVANDATFAGNLLYGTDPSKPLANQKVNLVNDKGEIIATTTTNSKGAFVFRNLPADQNFLVKVDESNPKLEANTKITITNKKGEEMQTTNAGDKGQFKFTFLSSDKVTMKEMSVEDSELKFDFKGRLANEYKSPLINSVVNLVNEKGEILKTTRTDAKGGFQFVNLPSDKSMLFALEEENDSKIQSSNKLFLTDSNGKIIKEFTRNKNGKFDFTLLPSDLKKLGELYVDDTQLSFTHKKTTPKAGIKTEPKTEPKTNETIATIENLYYDFDEYLILPQSIKTLYKITDIMQKNPDYFIEFSSYSDARGTADYNLKLSMRRAKSAKDFLIVEGIDAKRISAKGYGETNLVNSCGDNKECSEEQHQENRRTEVKIFKKQEVLSRK